MRITLALPMLAVAIVALLPVASLAQDEDFSIVVNPQTGSASLRNDGDSAVSLDGYLLTAGQSTFDAAAWDSLEDQATGGWIEGQANDTVISEVNLTTSLFVNPGELVPIGSPYSPFVPSTIGEPEPEFSFSYSIEGVGVFPGELEFAVDNNIVLEIDPVSGAASLVNQSVFPVSIDSYLIQSSEGVLSSGGWSTLEGNVGGWQSFSGSATRLAEGNIDGSTLIAANGGTLPLGNPINPGLLTDESEVELQFSIAAGGAPGQALVGGVLFVPGAPIDADFNNDLAVNAADLAVWEANYGGPATDATGDANSDGVASGFDFLAWQRQFTGNPGLAASAVPEPSSCCFLTIGVLVYVTRRR